jgi:hypothetical protein
MEPKKYCAKISQNVISPDETVLGRIDVNALLKRADVARPYGAPGTVDGEIETRLSKAVPGTSLLTDYGNISIFIRNRP